MGKINFNKVKAVLPIWLSLALGVGIAGYNVPKIISSTGIVVDAEGFDFFKDEDKSFEDETETTETPETEETTEETEDELTNTFRESQNVLDALKKIESDLKDNYSEYVDLVASKIDDVTDKRDIVGDFAIYRTMLANGYISYGDFAYSTPRVEVNTLRGANVVIGDGVCLNEAHNMADVFESLGYLTKVVIGTSYHKGETKPSDPNHAVVYVSDGHFSYVLDPTNDTIYLRHSHLLYYSIESQEDTIFCFEPSIYYHKDHYGTYISAELLGDLFNDHKKHWEVLKAYNNYKEAAQEYLDEFKTYEEESLLSYEEYFNKVYTLIYDTFMEETQENESDVKRLSY